MSHRLWLGLATTALRTSTKLPYFHNYRSFQLPTIKYEFNKRNFIIRSLFDYVWCQFTIYHSICHYHCFIYFLFDVCFYFCKRLRLTYVLNSDLTWYALTTSGPVNTGMGDRLTVSGFNSRCGTFISVCDQPPRLTQPGHPFVGRRNEYQPNSGDALRLGSKGRYGSCVGGK